MRRRANWWSITIIVGVIAILSGSIFIYQTIERREREAIEMEERRVREAYNRINIAFGMCYLDSTGRNILIEDGESAIFLQDFEWSEYRAYHEEPWGVNEFHINVTTYLPLRFYENRTRIYIPYEKIKDYFSQEFEVDGSLRLYNNGNHPEIEAFVNWFWNNLADFVEFDNRVRELYWDYIFTNEGFERRGTFFNLSPQMIDALARAEANPDYVLDLTSLREKGY